MVVIITVDSIIVLTKQQSTEGYLANLFFASNFVNFQSILAAHRKKKTFQNFLESLHKKTLWQGLILVKLQAFTEAAT